MTKKPGIKIKGTITAVRMTPFKPLFFYYLLLFFLLLLLVCIILFTTLPLRGNSVMAEIYNVKQQKLTQILFISCNKHNMDQSYWDLIASTIDHNKQKQQNLNNSNIEPIGSCTINKDISPPPLDALIWLGDAVYADNFSLSRGSFTNQNIELMRSKFIQQRSNPEYMAFRQTCVRNREKNYILQGADAQRIMGVWDDHDMGKNDGGAEYADKDIMQQIYLDFLGVSKEDSRRKQKGVYSFETVSFENLIKANNNNNNNNNKTTSENSTTMQALEVMQKFYDNAICIILLDVRYFRDPVNASLSGDMLGELQWNWLEQHLRENVSGINPITSRQRCALTLIGSGIQIIMDEKVSENWGAFLYSRTRLFNLLRRYRTERVLFISGDVHLGEIGVDSSLDAFKSLGFPIIEATSSGLTHSSAKFIGLPTFITILFPTPRRVGVYVERNFGILQLTFDPKRFHTLLKEEIEKLGNHHFEDFVNISISIHSIPEKGKSVIELNVPLSTLTYNSGCKFLKSIINNNGYISFNSIQNVCKEPSKENGEISINHYNYPFSSPRPVFTWTMQILQRYVWPNHSLLGVVFNTIFTGFIIIIIIIIAIKVFFYILQLCNKCQKNDKRRKII